MRDPLSRALAHLPLLSGDQVVGEGRQHADQVVREAGRVAAADDSVRLRLHLMNVTYAAVHQVLTGTAGPLGRRER